MKKSKSFREQLKRSLKSRVKVGEKSNLKRYNLIEEYDGEAVEIQASIVESSDGCYVKYEDVRGLKEENDRLKAEIYDARRDYQLLHDKYNRC